MELGDVSIGTTIRRIRRWRGLTLEAAAGLAGLSKGYLSKVENGRVPLDRRSTLTAIAGALRVSLYDLTGDGLAIRDPAADGTIPCIRQALLDTDLDGDARPSGALPALVHEAQLLAALRQANQEAEVGTRLPALLYALHTHTAEPEALRALVTTTHTTAMLTKGLGAPDLTWIAAERCYDAAQLLADPEWIALAEFVRTQALSGLGAHHRADKLARRALETVPADAHEVRGALTLTTGFTASVLGAESSDAALDEAAGLARHTSEGNRRYLLFSPANVTLWRISAALERGDHAAAAALAARIDPAELTINSRRTTFYIELARAAYGLRRPEPEVLGHLVDAERLGAIRTRANPFAREVVTALFTKSGKGNTGRELRGLADRMGLLKPARPAGP